MYDNEGRLLSDDDIRELMKTPEGQEEFKAYMLRLKVAFGIYRILEHLYVVPSAKQQQEICSIMYDTLFVVPIDTAMEWARQVGMEIEKSECKGNA